MKKYNIPPNQHIPNSILADNILIELVKEHSTPIYLYDKTIIEKKWQEIRSKFNFEIFYSVKANPFNDVLKLFDNLYANFEIASYGELLKLKTNNINFSKVLFVGPAKTNSDLEFAIRNDINLIVVESKNELIRINEIASKLHKNTAVLLRVNPQFNAGAIINMSGITQFGMEKTVVIDVIKKIDQFNNINLMGLHFYLGTNILNIEQIQSNIKKTLNLCQEIEKKTERLFSIIDIGGGFGIPYYEKDLTINLDMLASNINDAVSSYLKHKKTKIIMELGRYLVGESGIFVTKVVDIKTSFGKKFIMLDGGTNFFGGGNRNMGFRITPIKVLNSTVDKKEVVTLVGSLCTSSDVLANNVLLPKIKIGDYISFYQAGAYNFTASPVLFLSHTLPKEILI